MRKLFLKFSTLLFVLALGTNVVWAGSMLDDLQESNPDQYEQIMTVLQAQNYCARLTGYTSSSGGGKVYVNTGSDPRDGVWTEGSNVAVNGMGMSMAGMTKIGINAWAKADPGYWFVGWSYANMGTDLGTKSSDEAPEGSYADAYEIATAPNETLDYVIYATFEPIHFAGYSISEGNTTESKVCQQTVTVTMEGTEIDAADFKTPTISDSKGGGTWAPSSLTIDGNTISLTVNFTAPDDAAADYSANLVLETQANVKMNIPLNARTASSANVEAIRYNKNKVQQGQGDVNTLIAAAQTGDIIKLNQNIAHQVVVSGGKTITLDLNGYDITNTYMTPGAETDPTRIQNATLLINNAGGEVTLAYSPYGGKIVALGYNDAIDILGGKLTLNGGTIVANFMGIGAMGSEVVQNGATIVGYGCAIASMDGRLTIKDGKMYGLVGSMMAQGTEAEMVLDGGVIDNTAQTIEGVTLDGGIALQIGSGTATLYKGTLIGANHALNTVGQAGKVTSVTVKKNVILKTTSGEPLVIGGGTTTIDCAKFDSPVNLCSFESSASAANNLVFNSAYFLEDAGMSTIQSKPIWRNTSGAEFREGYEYFAGSAADAKTAGVSVCHIGGTSYASLEDALAYANNTNEQVVIIMDNDYTLPAGYYTLPSNAKLLVPMSNEQGAETEFVTLDYSQNTPTVFRKLTFEDGVNFDVFGTIEISGSQYSGDDDHTGATSGAYGLLQLNQGSKITLQNGSILRAWGYVTGDIAHKDAQHNVPTGEIDARRGSTVYELFQMGDWGNTIANGIGLVANDSHFPISSYYIQNIESPVKYHPGAHLLATTTVSAAGGGLSLTMCANNIQIIGVNPEVAMFLMDNEADAENTWVRKWYDASKDQQVYEINSGAHIGNLVINLASSPLFEGMEVTLAAMGGTLGLVGNIAQNMGAHFDRDLVMNSGQYVLPITSNFKLHLLSGSLDFTQSTELIPGSELEIDKEATVYVTDQNDPNVLEGSLYIYDWQDWEKPAQKVSYSPAFDDGAWGGAVPDDVRNVSNVEALGSAKVNVHGTFDTQDGYVFTSEHGGNIFSSIKDAGTFMFTTAAKAADYYEEVKITTGFSAQGLTGETVNCYSAYLKNSADWVANGGDEYVYTGGTEAGLSYCYLDVDGRGGHWTSLEQRGCFTYDAASETYYIKPQEYVPVIVEAEWNGKKFTTLNGNADHTFSDAVGAGRLFINLGNGSIASDCQWWEVEAKDNYFHCIHPENDTYYEWNGSKWVEKKFTITWKNWDGSTITTYTVPYGTQAEWLSNNPTRDADIDYTYDFVGWTPALGKVTSDVTYTASYDAKQIKYTITFVRDGGTEIERHLLARDEVPVCENTPTRTGYILQWEPGIEPVVGNQTYTATWLPEPPAQYTITFKNYNGAVLQTGKVNANTTPTTPADPTKPGTSEYTYSFAGWKPALAPATTNMTYVAQFNKVANTYEINFYDEAGLSVLKTQNLTYGATPTPPTGISKSNPAAGTTYTYVWQNKDDASKNIETVTAAANYKPVFTGTLNKYTVTLKSNQSNVNLVGSGIYNHGESIDIEARFNENQYTFDCWKDKNNVQQGTNATLGNYSVTSDITYTAYLTAKTYTVTWKNGETTLETDNSVLFGVTPEYNSSIPTKEEDEESVYTFDGWSLDADGEKLESLPKVGSTGENSVFYAHYATARKTDIVAGVGMTRTLTENTEKENLIITSNGVESGQLLGLDTYSLTLTGDAFFDLAIDAKTHTWYPVAVPWTVDAENGIFVNGNKQEFGVDFDLLFYDGQARADNGANGSAWKYVEDEFNEGNRIMQPGKLYMIGLMKDAPVIRFVWNKQGSLLTTSTTVSTYGAAATKDRNWNGIANPALYYASLDAENSFGQFWNTSSKTWVAKKLSTIGNGGKLSVAQPFFVQSNTDGSIVASTTAYMAPARRKTVASKPACFDLQIASEDQLADRLYIIADENKEENEYVIGQDLAKMAVATSVAQMWVTRYDANLCVNTIAPVNNVAEYPLGIYSPKAGEYSIYIDYQEGADNLALDLTFDGKTIWNLSDGAYTATLDKGTIYNYGLRVRAKNPQTATGIDNINAEGTDGAKKVLIGNQIYIFRGNNVYSVDGRLLK